MKEKAEQEGKRLSWIKLSKVLNIEGPSIKNAEKWAEVISK